MTYARPATLKETLRLLQSGAARILAGGTDVYPATQAQSLTGDVLDLTGIAALRGIAATPDGLRIGACTTWSEIAEADLPPALSALQQAARMVGGRQIQNAATLAGNLCNASPAADGVPALLVCDAMVEIIGPDGPRTLPLADFITGPRRTALQQGELVTAIHLPADALSGRAAFVKLGARAHLVISIAMAAARVVMDGDRIARVALSVGACSPVARRLPELEGGLIGQTLADALAQITPAALAPYLSPIDDIRATAAYRIEAAAELLRRALAQAAGGGA